MATSKSSAGDGKPGYSIWIVTPPGYQHSRCFEEVALALGEAFAELGYHAPIVTDPAAVQGIALVLGPNLLPRTPKPWPKQMVLFNLEQVQADSPWLTPEIQELLRRHPVLDYSARNLPALAALGIKAIRCGIGYSPGLTRIPHALVQDIDVCFVGSLNPRREAVLGELQRHGLKVHYGFGVYGSERDAVYARSKIVLNVHHYDAQVFEIVRVSYLLANRLCVVSEVGRDNETEVPFANGVAFAYYGELVAACRTLVAHPDRRRAIAASGFEAIKARPQAPMLAAALAALPASLRV